jgi:hypothetical protein
MSNKLMKSLLIMIQLQFNFCSEISAHSQNFKQSVVKPSKKIILCKILLNWFFQPFFKSHTQTAKRIGMEA